VHHQVSDGARRHRDYDKINIYRYRRLDRPGTEPSRNSGMADLVITQMNLVAGGREGASD
jgi:hypothetical protein